MKIVYIATSTIPSRTANSIHVMKMCQAFAQNGHEVTLIVPDNQANCEPGVEDVFDFYGVKKCFEILYLPLFPVKGKGLIYGFQAAKKTKELQPDIVYGRDLLGCFFASLLKLPVMFESHAPIEGSFYGAIFRIFITKPTFRKLVVITHALKDYYSEQYPLLSKKIIVAPDGADPVPENIKPVALPNKGKRLQVGYVGHLYSGRGIDVIYQLAERCPWVDFHVVGGTNEDIDAIRARIASLANLRLHGFKPPAEVEGYRIGFDILLAPYQRKVSVAGGGITTTEKWMSPLKIFEYMATGKAIICSDMPVLREILEDKQNALLCDPENIDSWEEALIILSQNENMRIQLGEAARNDFVRRYSWYSRAEKLLKNTSTR
jgi:glycosyltransferase involved in cell wall biosynthesis